VSSEILILGKKGFLASHLISFFFKKKVNFLSLGSDDIDLTTEQSASKLASIKKKYSIIFCSAITPDKGKDEFCYLKNVNMIVNFFKYFKKENISHFYYISSDAVYNLKNEVINEVTPADPSDLYGLMHLTREKICSNHISESNLTIIRMTLVYGVGDTHNSYGPNRFAKDILEKNQINLFNHGQDTRDFIHISDVVNIILFFIKNKINGIFNLATGKSYKFINIATMLRKISDNEIKIVKVFNNSKVTNRRFLIKKLKSQLIDYKFSNIKNNFSKYFQ
jgi:nucleoside-diphosphate-sugar epimerase